ncbi:MAG: calcium-translocating P-type ATPase, PMCA-type [Eubacteriales bacterium]|nr:calcium-translocating P-type ATPase, PMCA-type [Eubacteriales bacterium]
MQQSFHAMTAEETLSALNTAAGGLSPEEAAARLTQYGENQLAGGKPKTKLQMLLEQFKSFMIYVLLAAALVSGLLGEWTDAAIIFAIVILNAVMGMLQESNAQNAMAALRDMSAPHAKVRRNGQELSIPAKEVVPGDIVLLDAGDLVPADLRILDSGSLQIQESALTGESAPVDKSTAPVAADAALGDRTSLAFSGSLVSYGRGVGVVIATGMETEVGHIAHMVETAEETDTPLKRRLESLGKTLGIVCIVICAAMFGVGMLYGREPLHMFLLAVSLAVAAIPEGLPAITTVVQAMGVKRMVKRNAIVRTLPSVETLGSATVICSDKTGTLTQNRMTVMAAAFNGSTLRKEAMEQAKDDPGLQAILSCAVLCNDATVAPDGAALGDPTETALVEFAMRCGLDPAAFRSKLPRINEVPFDSERKRMSVLVNTGAYMMYTKGGLDEVLAACDNIIDNGTARPITDNDRAWLQTVNEELAGQALRVLAYAWKGFEEQPANLAAEEKGLTFLGVTGMIDPPREEAKQAVATCAAAGIRPVMITGDHKLTAIAIARELGIYREGDTAITGVDLEKMDDEELYRRVRDISVYARVSPAHKMRIIHAWQRYGDVVAMTGDGVNDAPALKKADIGCAMGNVGTEVAKEAADVILTDDNFATVVSAVEEGRRIYDNIKKTIQFLLSSNLAEILVLLTATLLNLAEPLLAVHILWINLLTDSLPALALGLDPAEPGIMQRQPQRGNSLFTRPIVTRIGLMGLMIGALTFTGFLLGEGTDVATGRTMAFAVLSLSELVHAFNLRSEMRSLLSVHIMGNKWLFAAAGGGILLTLATMEIPFLREVFSLTTLSGTNWLWVAALSIAPLVIVELVKLVKRLMKK